MEFLNPGALYTGLLLPLLLAAYLVRRRPRRVVFSSLLFLRDLSTRASNRPWGALRLPPIFFLQLLLLALLVLSLGGPVFSTRALRVAVVLDTSASMQAREGQRSRFELALDAAHDLLGGLAPRAQVDLYRTLPRLERVGEIGLSIAEAPSAMKALAPLDLGEPPPDYGAELSRLEKEGSYERLVLITDRPSRGRSDTIRVITVGQARDNLALTSFHVSRSALTERRLLAAVEISNFSPRAQRVELLIKAGDETVASRTAAVGARGRAAEVFESLPPHPRYVAEIKADDALAVDNRRVAVITAPRGLVAIGVSPRPESVWSLRSIPGLNLKTVPPAAYAGAPSETAALEIFHLSAPAALPRSRALLILPPERNPLARVGRPVAHPVISAWRESHPVNRYVNFTLFRPAYARPLEPLSAGAETVIGSPQGPLALALERDGFRYLVLGFDPLPFLGRENLPMSIFTLNALDWLSQNAASAASATGEPIPLGASKGGTLVTPDGLEHRFGPESRFFAATYQQGLYQVVRGAEREYRAVNFTDLKESDLHNPAAITVVKPETAASGKGSVAPLWPHLLLASVGLFFLEWFLNPPAARANAGARRERGRSG